MRYVVIPPERYDGYYNEVSNRILWMVHHNLWDIPRSPLFDDGTQEAWQDFVEANRSFAEALAQEADNDPVYLIQDYHLCLVPGMLRELVPEAKIVHFSHTPFAGATYLRVLPVTMRTAILRGMAGADVLGFQAKQWAENYLLSARSLPELRVLRGGRIESRRPHGRGPVVPGRGERRAAARDRQHAEAADEVRAELREWAGDAKIMLRVDRLEPSKNILRGFLAYELFLRRNPSWVGSVRFLCLFSPSREDVPEYQNYGEECLAVAERINVEFGTRTWQPIEVRVQEDYAFAVAAYDLYDLLFVNPTYDGMNLVAMEGPLVNRRDGVLVLSRNAGAFSRLGRQSLGVNPFDLAETAEAIREGSRCPRTNGPAGRAGSRARCRRTRRRTGSPISSKRSIRCGRRDAAARRLPCGSEPSQQGDEPRGTVDDHVGGIAQRHGRLPAVHRDLHGAQAAFGEPVERLERPDVGHVVARVEHRVEPLVLDDAFDRAFLQRPPCRHELDHHLARAAARAPPRARPARGQPRAGRWAAAASSAAR